MSREITIEDLNNNLLKGASAGWDTDFLANQLFNGADVNCVDTNGRTPLFLASINQLNRNIDNIIFLLSKRANINQVDNNNRTPLMEAIIRQDVEMCRILLDNGADYKDNNEIVVARNNSNREIRDLFPVERQLAPTEGVAPTEGGGIRSNIRSNKRKNKSKRKFKRKFKRKTKRSLRI